MPRGARPDWGTGLGGASTIEESYRLLYIGGGRVRPSSVVLGMSNAAAGQISIANKLHGPVLNVSTACSSSAASIGEAYRAIKAGYADVIVAGGSDTKFRALAGLYIDKNNRIFTSEQYPGRVQMFRYFTDDEARAQIKQRQAGIEQKKQGTGAETSAPVKPASSAAQKPQ